MEFSTDILQVLKERGLFKQSTDEKQLKERFSNSEVTFYCGFDPTALSLHCGNLVPIMAMTHLQQAGHRPIFLLGGGTAMIGDPSGKTEMRKMLTKEQIESNGAAFKSQIGRFIDIEKALFLNNAEWLLSLNYVDFLREIGVHFSVNRMLSFEAYKARLERGLSFIEFNYQLLQAYDFLMLHDRHNCLLQLGGDDQWGNIVAGVDLVRRVRSCEAGALTFPLILTHDGKKMGKSEKGAVFLDQQLTSVHDFYQYWRNTADQDVERFLRLFTFLPIEECRELGALKDEKINQAKERLAYEITKVVHGEREAERARGAAKALFSSDSSGMSHVPSLEIESCQLKEGINIVDLYNKTSLCSSKSEARRLVLQGGASVNGESVSDVEATVNESWLKGGEILLKAGKKRFFRVTVKPD